MRVLVIDDERGIGGSLMRYAAVRGVSLSQSLSCAEGVARALGDSFDAILLDLRLPDGSGLRVIDALRAAGRSTPVVVYSGYLDLDAALSAGRLGVASVISKPAEPQSVLSHLFGAARMGASEPATVNDSVVLADRRDLECVAVQLLGSPALDLRQFLNVAAALKSWLELGTPAAADHLLSALSERLAPQRADRYLAVIAASTCIDATDLARACGVSPRTLGRELHQETRRSIRQWARLARVRRAVERLVRTTTPVAQCAFEAGYPTARQFDRDAHTELGMGSAAIRRATAGSANR